MAGNMITLTNPERVRDAVLARQHQLALSRAEIKRRRGTHNYDRILKADTEPHRIEMLEKLSLALGWQSDGIARIDSGGEPVELASEVDRLAVVEATLTALLDEFSQLVRVVEALSGEQVPGLRRRGEVP